MKSQAPKLCGVIGWPVAHSRSPLMHNHWIAQHQLAAHYLHLPVKPDRLGAALRGLSALGFVGCNLTIPHKVEAMALVDRVDANARKVGAINTVVVEPDGSLSGSNTDGFGFIQSLRDAKPAWLGGSGPAAVVGAGGAARAVVVGLIEQGCSDIRLINRSANKAQALADELGADITCVAWADRHEALRGAALLVNTTSQGMQGEPALDLLLDHLPTHSLVSDIIYTPLETPLLAQARMRGHMTVNGLGMLMHQARPSFRAWFGLMPEITPELQQIMQDSVNANA